MRPLAQADGEGQGRTYSSRRGRLWLSLVVLGLVFWLGLTHFASHAQAPLPSPTPLPNQDRRFDLGIWLRETQPSVGETILGGYLDAASQQLNLNWVAVQLRWDYLEPQAGNLVWGSWDRFFQLAAERNLKVLVTVIGAPEWARNPQADSTALAPPADPAHLSSFLTALLTRYPNQIHALQLWEGINVWSQWGLPLQAEAYLELLAAVTPTIRALDPHLILISAALEPSSGNNPLSAIDDFTYLDNLLAGGLLTWVDCVGMQHKGYNLAPGVAFDALPPPDSSLIFRGPYETPHHSWSFYSTLTTYARKIAAQGSTTPLCVTRFGWASAQDYEAVPIPMRFALDNSLEEQAQWLLEAIELMDYQGWVWLAMLDNLNVAPEEGFSPQSPAAFYSLIRPGYGLALAWDDIAALNFKGR